MMQPYSLTRVLCGLLLLSAVRCSHPAPVRLGAWVSYWDFDASMAAVPQAPGLRDVFLFIGMLDAQGKVVLAGQQERYAHAIAAVRQAQAVPWLTVVNDVQEATGRKTLKAADVVHTLLSRDELRQQHRQDLVQLAESLHVGGVDIDYENLQPEDRMAFSTFIAELAGDLHARHLYLAVTVQPKVRETHGVGSGAHDWAALCHHVDRLQIMLYNEHNGRTVAGPVASVSWIRRVMDYSLTQCPAQRLVPALKVTGMDWGKDTFRELPFAQIMLGAQRWGATVSRGAEDAVPLYRYIDPQDNMSHTVYFEDAESLTAKLRAVRGYGVGAVMLWNLSREDPNFWRRVAGL